MNLDSHVKPGWSLTADELLSHYASLVFAESGSYQETARRLDVDRRTARGKVNPTLVAAFRSSARAT